MRAATVEGSPKTPLPMMEFTTNATRLQRPMARISSWLGGFGEGVSIRAFVSQPGVILDKQSRLRRSASPTRFAYSGQGWLNSREPAPSTSSGQALSEVGRAATWSLVTLEPMATALLAENQASGSMVCERAGHPFDMA